MKIELLKNWRHEGGKLFRKGETIDVHPSDAKILIKKKIAKIK
jgi:hypothetical protein